MTTSFRKRTACLSETDKDRLLCILLNAQLASNTASQARFS